MHTPKSLKPVMLNGVGVFPFTHEGELLDYIDENKGILVAINAEKILHADAKTKSIINRNIGYCDGAGAMMALKKKGVKNAIKIPGCELWLKITEKFHSSRTFYLLGSKPEVIQKTVNKLKQEYPDINIAGFHDGYLKTKEIYNQVIQEIIDLNPDIIFVAMGSPKQELIMEELQKRHSAIYQGLGGSFDVYAGLVQRAPSWWVDHNLEFAYRLFREPKRIKRQIHLVKFAWWLITNKL